MLPYQLRLRMQAEYIVGHWGKGGTSYAKLARKYGVPLSTVERWAARDDWYAQRCEVWRLVREARRSG